MCAHPVEDHQIFSLFMTCMKDGVVEVFVSGNQQQDVSVWFVVFPIGADYFYPAFECSFNRA
jgi:hypothetical protein